MGEAKRRGTTQQRLDEVLEERQRRADAEREKQRQARLEKAHEEQQLFDADEARYGTEKAWQRRDQRKRLRHQQYVATAQLAGMILGAFSPPSKSPSPPSFDDDPTLPF